MTAATKSQPARKEPEERGIGGHQHNLIRERIETLARTLGFSVAREKQTPDGGKIDTALERPGQFIACEISIMTPVDYEVGNVAKCLKTGCSHVAAICPDAAKLAKIQKAVAGCLPATDLARVGYYSPDQFIEYLKVLKPPAEGVVPQSTETKYGSRTVRRHVTKLAPEEIRAREAAAHRVMAETMKQP